MRTIPAALVSVLLFATASPAPAAPDERGLAGALAEELVARRALRPRTHATDFGTDRIGCITLTRRELRRFGYRGHAFLCEEGSAGEVLGAVLRRSGAVRCYIHGMYAGDTCYDFEICGIPETACVYR